MFDETPTKIHLTIKRGISIDIPEVIRHHPGTSHPTAIGKHQGMVCKVWKWNEGTLCGVHITYLNPDGTKASLTPVKVMRGVIKGAGVWFGEPADKLNIAEGIETALSVYQMTSVATVAALSAGNMAALILPKSVKFVTIAADNDTPGLNAAQKAAEKFNRQGLSVEIQHPPIEGMDWNDVLTQRGIAA